MSRAALIAWILFALAVGPGCYQAHTVGGPRADAGVDAPLVPRDSGADAAVLAPDAGHFGDCRSDLDCPPPVAACARAMCFDVSCRVLEIPGACPFDSRCDPTRGCVPDPLLVDAAAPDASRPDVGVPDVGSPDAAFVDAFTPDAGAPRESAAIRCTVDSVLRVPNHSQLNFGPTGTLELWVLARGPGIIAIKGTPEGAHYFTLRLDTDASGAITLFAGWGIGGAERGVRTGFGGRMGVWTHVALVQQDLGPSVLVSLLIDGAAAASATVADDFIDVTNSLDFRLCTLDADLDEVRLWRVAREETSIVGDLRRRLAPGIVGLSAYWPLEGSGQIVLDRSVHGAEGVLGENSDVEPWDPVRISDGAF